MSIATDIFIGMSILYLSLFMIRAKILVKMFYRYTLYAYHTYGDVIEWPFNVSLRTRLYLTFVAMTIGGLLRSFTHLIPELRKHGFSYFKEIDSKAIIKTVHEMHNQH